MPKVLNKYKDKIPKDAINCMRPGPYGNKFIIGKDGTREEVLIKFVKYQLPSMDVSALKGKDLICVCAPKACHCDYILIKANHDNSEANALPIAEESATVAN